MNKTVEKTLENYLLGLSKQSWSAVEEYFHDNCTIHFIEATYQGKKQIGTAIGKTFSMIKDEDFILENIKWNHKSDTFAACTFVYKWTGTIHGRRFTTPGRGTIVWVKEDDRWQIVVEHFGPMPK